MRTKNRRKYIENWLKVYGRYLKRQPIEKKLDMAKEGISRFLLGSRSLTDNDIEKLEKFIEEMIDVYENGY